MPSVKAGVTLKNVAINKVVFFYNFYMAMCISRIGSHNANNESTIILLRVVFMCNFVVFYF